MGVAGRVFESLRQAFSESVSGMNPSVSPVQSSEAFPTSVDVVVVGAGIAGVATAWELARRGVSVAVIEKGRVGAEQSSRNWGWCRQQNRNPKEIPLSQLAARIWRTLNTELGEETGFRQTGLLYGSSKPADVSQWAHWGEIAKGYGVETHMLTGAELAARLPGNTRQWVGGVWSPTDGRAEPELAVSAMARGAMRQGAQIIQHCAVRELDVEAGQVRGVVTEYGRIRSQSVLVAGGAWSGMLMRHHGVALTQACVKSTCFYTGPAAPVIDSAVSMENIALRRRLDGGYTVGLSGQGQLQITPWGMLQARAFWETFKMRRKNLSLAVGHQFFDGPESLHRWNADGISPFERVRILDPEPDAGLIRLGLERLAAIYPALAGVRPACAWGGMVDNMPDAIPVISAVDKMPGLFLSTGYSAHGFGIGPGAGRLAAELICGDTPSVDPTPFRYSRMVEGRWDKPGML